MANGISNLKDGMKLPYFNRENQREDYLYSEEEIAYLNRLKQREIGERDRFMNSMKGLTQTTPSRASKHFDSYQNVINQSEKNELGIDNRIDAEKENQYKRYVDFQDQININNPSAPAYNPTMPQRHELRAVTGLANGGTPATPNPGVMYAKGGRSCLYKMMK